MTLSSKWIISSCHGWVFWKDTEIISFKTAVASALVFGSVQPYSVSSQWKDREDLQMSHKVILYLRCTFTTKTRAWINCLPDFAVLFKVVCSILPRLSPHAWLGWQNKNVDTLFQQMRNDKCINHSGSATLRFRFDTVSGLVRGSADENFRRAPGRGATADVLKRTMLFKPEAFIIRRRWRKLPACACALPETWPHLAISHLKGDLERLIEALDHWFHQKQLRCPFTVNFCTGVTPCHVYLATTSWL